MVANPGVRRLEANPIVRPEMLPGRDGSNINGPSLIRVPDWVDSALGRYYLYFAHHAGTYIRLAYADRLEGPWGIYEPGALRLEEVPAATDHVASPDVHVDDERREIRMYFHAPARDVGDQVTFVGRSRHGIAFAPSDEFHGGFYFRVFRWRERWYALAKGGDLYRSEDGLSGFERGPNPFPNGGDDRDPDHNAPGSIRHVAVDLEGDSLRVYFTRIGDAPERILRTRIELSDDWATWRPATPPEEVLRPELESEGAKLDARPSRSGAASGPENALRDPCVFAEGGRRYVLYSIAGESGIGIAELGKAPATPARSQTAGR